MVPSDDDKNDKSGTHKRQKPALRRGLPADESVIETKPFTSPKGRKYRIIKTREKDGYEEDGEK
jgi:hypothetical protein